MRSDSMMLPTRMKTLHLLLLSLLSATSAKASGPVVSCCLKISETRVPVNKLKSYYVQSGVCSVEAVQFTTVKDKTICSDPSDPWAKRAMQDLDAKKLTKTTKMSDPRTGTLHLSPTERSLLIVKNLQPTVKAKTNLFLTGVPHPTTKLLHPTKRPYPKTDTAHVSQTGSSHLTVLNLQLTTSAAKNFSTVKVSHLVKRLHSTTYPLIHFSPTETPYHSVKKLLPQSNAIRPSSVEKPHHTIKPPYLATQKLPANTDRTTPPSPGASLSTAMRTLHPSSTEATVLSSEQLPQQVTEIQGTTATINLSSTEEPVKTMKQTSTMKTEAKFDSITEVPDSTDKKSYPLTKTLHTTTSTTKLFPTKVPHLMLKMPKRKTKRSSRPKPQQNKFLLWNCYPQLKSPLRQNKRKTQRLPNYLSLQWRCQPKQQRCTQ
ncbi:fractalkine-like [Scleropages formosus]|uniref:fractalkine-like n=1 Tax=Scleropages formosus TaxID=113540 RepID=UPI0010FA7C43|nr:fractalkine-like [Scleropages formosus]